MARPLARRRSAAAALPAWIPPQLTQLVETAPEGDQWLHEIKFDGYRMHARLDRGAVKLLTRTGLDWTHKYPPIAAAVASLGARQAYLDGELCGVFPDGITSFSMIQAASDAGNAAGLVYFIFDLLHRRRRGCRRLAADRAQGAAGRIAVGRRAAFALQRLSPRRGRGLPRAGLQAGARGHRLETRRRALRARQSRHLAQGQMPLPRGICRGRLDRSGRTAAVSRRAAARLLRSGRAPASTPAGSGLGSSRPSWSGSGEGWRRLLPTRCRWIRHRPEPTALGHH